MMANGYSYSTYMNWDMGVPVVVSLLTIILTVVMVKTSIVWFKCCSGGRHFLEFAYHFAKLVLRDSLQKETTPVHRIVLYDRRVSPLSVVLLFTLVPAIFIPAFISFWGTFLVEESFACDSGLDCFLRDPTSFSIADQQPLVNCTDHENDTVVCFQFVFDYTGGFAAMGGFLAVATTCLKIYGIVLVWLIELLPSSISRRRGKCHYCRVLCPILGIFVFFLTPIILSAIILLLVLLVPLFSDVILQSNASILKFAAYWSSLLYVGPMAGGCILAAVVGSNLSRRNFYIGGRDAEDGGSLEAPFSDSYNMSHQPPPREPNSVRTSDLTSINSPVKSKPQPAKSQWEEPDFKYPLVGSVMSTCSDVTTLPTRHSESSVLLSGVKTDYQTTT